MSEREKLIAQAEALEWVRSHWQGAELNMVDRRIAELRALAVQQSEAVEPVAWMAAHDPKYLTAYKPLEDWWIPLYTHPQASAPADQPATFQERVRPWMLACFGETISNDITERNHRFVEESLELAQSKGCTASEAHQLVDYVFGRPVGEPAQEVGGVMVTLAALCLASGLDMQSAGETELARIWTKIDKIRAKQAAKPAHSPLPEKPAAPADDLDALVARLGGSSAVIGGAPSAPGYNGSIVQLDDIEQRRIEKDIDEAAQAITDLRARLEQAFKDCDMAAGYINAGLDRIAQQAARITRLEAARELESIAEELAVALKRAESELFPHKVTSYAKAALARYQAMKEKAK